MFDARSFGVVGGEGHNSQKPKYNPERCPTRMSRTGDTASRGVTRSSEIAPPLSALNVLGIKSARWFSYPTNTRNSDCCDGV